MVKLTFSRPSVRAGDGSEVPLVLEERDDGEEPGDGEIRDAGETPDDGLGVALCLQPPVAHIRMQKKKSPLKAKLFFSLDTMMSARAADWCKHQRHLSSLHGGLGFYYTKPFDFAAYAHQEFYSKILVYDFASAKPQHNLDLVSPL